MPGSASRAPSHSVAAQEAHQALSEYLIADGFPLIFDYERSHGSWVVDATTEKPYLDFYSFFASLPLGFHHPAFHLPENRERLYQASIHKPSNSDADSTEFASFVRQFSTQAMPEPFCHLFFIEGGALAVENALKTTFDWKARKNLAHGRSAGEGRILHFREAFHGRSGYTMSLTNTLPIKTLHFPKFDWPRVTNPKIRFPLDRLEEERVANEEKKALAEIRQAFADHPHEIAGIILEPIQGEGGDNHFRPEFFRALREVATEQEALLILDEVQTGFGTTGRFWAYEHFDVVPDIVCFGKKSQVCGIMAGPRVDEVEDNVFRLSSRLNSTWGGGLADMVRCQIILDVMKQENLVTNARDVGQLLLDKLEALATEFPERISCARGRGVFCAFDCASTELRDDILQRAREEGLLLLPCGSQSIRMRPALNISADEITQGMDVLEKIAAEPMAGS